MKLKMHCQFQLALSYDFSMCVEFNPTVGGTTSKKSKTRIVIGITTGIVATLICIILVFLLWRRRVHKLTTTDFEEDEGTQKRF